MKKKKKKIMYFYQTFLTEIKHKKKKITQNKIKEKKIY
jgi:hypothetical protein